MLKFLGRGSAFADEHNSAFFKENGDFVLIDCPATAFQKVKKMEEIKSSDIYILITHTHGDHSGGVGTMLQYAWFALNKKVTIVAPSKSVKNDLLILLLMIEGCEPEWFNIVTVDELKKDWLISSIPTQHVDTLSGRCFGYYLRIQGNDVVYTGDTATLEPFEPLLKKGVYLYTETAYYKSGVHLYIRKYLSEFEELSNNGIYVYLMHIDCEEEISKIIEGTKIKLAPLY